MKKASLTTLALAALMLLTTSSGLAAGKNCDKASHFSYGPLTPFASWTFTGSGGTSGPTTFTVNAPSGNGFPVNCATAATADIEATEVTKVADGNGIAISPISENGTSIGDAISAAFTFVPNPWANFHPGDSTTITVTVTNPNFTDGDLGDYDVKLAAHDNGAGIGVGPGPHFLLKLRAQTCTDTIPNVSIAKLNGDPPGILGIVPLTFTARDTCDPITEVAATVSSSGGAVNNVGITPLSVTYQSGTGLPIPANTLGTVTGSWTPYGGTGSPGTTDALAFTDVFGNRSGIGNYTITAQATDAGSITGLDTWTFNVNYAVNVTDAHVPPGCKNSNTSACQGQYKFTVNRSSAVAPDDGAFMYDHTVVVKLVRDSDNVVVATHPYGTGTINSFTQIDTTVPTYQTKFDHPGDPIQSYHAEVWFVNVDGTAIWQQSSISLSF